METLSDEDIRGLVSRMSSRQIRLLIEEVDLVTLQGVAEIVGVTYHRAKILRAEGLKLRGPRPDALPDPVPLPGGSPLFIRRDILDWGRRTGRVHVDGSPRRMRSAGRPPERCPADHGWKIAA